MADCCAAFFEIFEGDVRGVDEAQWSEMARSELKGIYASVRFRS